MSTPFPSVAFSSSAAQSLVSVLKAAVAPRVEVMKAHFESWRAVA
jgi:hypothetical protein